MPKTCSSIVARASILRLVAWRALLLLVSVHGHRLLDHYISVWERALALGIGYVSVTDKLLAPSLTSYMPQILRSPFRSSCFGLIHINHPPLLSDLILDINQRLMLLNPLSSIYGRDVLKTVCFIIISGFESSHHLILNRLQIGLHTGQVPSALGIQTRFD